MMKDVSSMLTKHEISGLMPAWARQHLDQNWQFCQHYRRTAAVYLYIGTWVQAPAGPIDDGKCAGWVPPFPLDIL